MHTHRRIMYCSVDCPAVKSLKRGLFGLAPEFNWRICAKAFVPLFIMSTLSFYQSRKDTNTLTYRLLIIEQPILVVPFCGSEFHLCFSMSHLFLFVFVSSFPYPKLMETTTIDLVWRRPTSQIHSGVFDDDGDQMSGRFADVASLSRLPSDLLMSWAVRRPRLQRFSGLALRSSLHGSHSKRYKHIQSIWL